MDCRDPMSDNWPFKNSCAVLDTSRLGDGKCDSDTTEGYNTVGCGYDMGDCCEDTCHDAEFVCNDNLLNMICLDPASEFVDQGGRVDGVEEKCDVPFPVYLGDGFCDDALPQPYNSAGEDTRTTRQKKEIYTYILDIILLLVF
jgi:hypothetical protein